MSFHAKCNSQNMKHYDNNGEITSMATRGRRREANFVSNIKYLIFIRLSLVKQLNYSKHRINVICSRIRRKKIKSYWKIHFIPFYSSMNYTRKKAPRRWWWLHKRASLLIYVVGRLPWHGRFLGMISGSVLGHSRAGVVCELFLSAIYSHF